MKLPARNVAWLLPFVLSGCSHFHKAQVPPDQWFVPPLTDLQKPPVFHPELPESALMLPVEPLAIDTDVEPEDLPTPKHRKPYRPVLQADSAPATPDEPPGVSAIGTLSTGEHSNVRSETEDSIAATERGLNGLNRSLNDQERKTVAQIREYIRLARAALLSGDVDGAHTLAEKAKAVLTELSQ